MTSLKRHLFMLLAVMLSPWGVVCMHAGTYSAATLPMTEQALGVTRVCNPDGILTPASVAAIDTALVALQRHKGVQALVVAAEHFDPDDPYEFALAVGNRYGVGTQQKTGMVVVLATLDRSYWILSGSGLEGFLSDAACRRVENRVMVPLLKQGQWSEAMQQTVQTLSGILMGEEELVGQYQNADDEDAMAGIGAMVVFMGFLGIFLWAVWYSERRQKKCPHCGQYTMKLVQRQCVKISRSQMMVTETRRCTHCHHQESRSSRRSSGEFYEGVFTGGSFGANPNYHGGGGGGTTFGGFGGGSFSGGGAGGRF